jgi:hypothetical protein
VKPEKRKGYINSDLKVVMAFSKMLDFINVMIFGVKVGGGGGILLEQLLPSH